jgi:pyruvate kinase
MLSAESAAGKWPAESVAMMAKIVVETEAQMRKEPKAASVHKRRSLNVPETICECMAHSAEDIDVAAIAIFTESGNTARLLSKYRPESPIYALSPDVTVVNRMMMLWGTMAIQSERFEETDLLVNTAEEMLLARGYVKERQVVGIVAGTATRSGATNFMRLHLIGDR